MSEYIAGYPYPPASQYVATLQVERLKADLAAKDAEITRLEQGWMASECSWMSHKLLPYYVCSKCSHTRQGTDYCQAVLDAVKGDK